ncbi:MAG: FtsX-like permease family protein, partial [Candidatus Aminicenantes bacterium]|nr:FtsX-like permease family protein [Candidatus Aminicenantes bacterium]
NIKKNKVDSFINIAGLSVGIASFILIGLHVKEELCYDQFHEKGDRIYRVVYEINRPGSLSQTAMTPAPLGPALVNDYPEVTNFTRLCFKDTSMSYRDKRFYEKLCYADSRLFDVFSFPLVKGNPDTVLNDPHSLVLTREMAQKYFGTQDPMGKTITIDGENDFLVTGILAPIPQNSHFHVNCIAPFKSLFEQKKGMIHYWGNIFFYTYILLAEDADVIPLEEKMPQFSLKYIGGSFKELFGDDLDKVPSWYRFHFQPLKRIHLHSHLSDEIEPNSDITLVYVHTAAALFILVIACINFMNLSTARSSTRAKEVGIRKVAGAVRGDLIKQFLGESFLFVLISLLLGLVLVYAFIPSFNAISGKELSLADLGAGTVFGFLASICVLVGGISGSYPAFFLSSFKPVDSLRGRLHSRKSRPLTRTFLVVFQFTVSILLIIGTLIIHNQMMFIQNKNLGFDEQNIIIVKDPFREVIPEYQAFKEELRRQSNVKAVSVSSGVPGMELNTTTVRPEGSEFNESISMDVLMVDYDFIETMGIQIAKGRNFSRDFVSDRGRAFIINQSAAHNLGWESPVGQKLEIIGGSQKGEVIGMAQDFHCNSLHHMIAPMMMVLVPMRAKYFVVKIGFHNVPQTIDSIGQTWNRFAEGEPFDYSFMDTRLDNLYQSEQSLEKTLIYFSILAVFIACLGLFGLASFAAEQRIKEIGIRKVLGASVSSLMLLLFKEYTKWVLLANIIAWPAAYFIMRNWLQNFAYRTSMELWSFILAGSLALFIAVVTMSFQTVKAALSNPVENLRYE